MIKYIVHSTSRVVRVKEREADNACPSLNDERIHCQIDAGISNLLPNQICKLELLYKTNARLRV